MTSNTTVMWTPVLVTSAAAIEARCERASILVEERMVELQLEWRIASYVSGLHARLRKIEKDKEHGARARRSLQKAKKAARRAEEQRRRHLEMTVLQQKNGLRWTLGEVRCG